MTLSQSFITVYLINSINVTFRRRRLNFNGKKKMISANTPVLSIARYFVSFSVFLFLAFSVSFKGSYGISGAFILLSYLFLLSSEVRQKISLSKVEKGLVIVLSMYLLSMVLEVVFYSLDVSEIDSESKILLFLPLIFLLNAVRVDPKIIVFGLAVGCLGLFSLAVYEKFVMGIGRVGTFINAIQLGNISLVIGLLSCVMAGYLYKSSKHYKIVCAFLILAGLCAIFAALTTLTRGGLVFLPLIVLVISCYFIKDIKLLRNRIKILLIIGLIGVVYVLSGSSVVNRTQTAINNVESYFQNDKATTSSGIRLELWKAAIIIAKDNPVFGVGEDQYLELKKDLIMRGELKSSILNYGHSHNAYMYALVRRGGVGLGFLLLLLTYPIFIAHRELRSEGNKARASSTSLMVFGLFFIFANLTQVLFAHNSGMIMYTGLLILLVHFNVENRSADNEKSSVTS